LTDKSFESYDDDDLVTDHKAQNQKSRRHTESQVSQLLHYHNPNCRTPAQSFESLYLLVRTQSCKMITMKKKKKKMLQQTDRLQPELKTRRAGDNKNLRYHNFSIITTLIAELLHSLLSLCIFL